MEHFQRWAAAVVTLCQRLPQVTLDKVQHFDHGKSATLWLDPQSGGKAKHRLLRFEEGPAAKTVECQIELSPWLMCANACGLVHVIRQICTLRLRPSRGWTRCEFGGCSHDVRVSAELEALQATLVEAFPSCTDLSDDPSRSISGFRPHLSLGQWRTAADAESAAKVSSSVPFQRCHSHACCRA